MRDNNLDKTNKDKNEEISILLLKNVIFCPVICYDSFSAKTDLKENPDWYCI